MILQRIQTFDGVQIIPKNAIDNILFNHCSKGEDVKDSQLPWISELLKIHGIKAIIVEDHSSVTEG
jgi:hypothetical protein